MAIGKVSYEQRTFSRKIFKNLTSAGFTADEQCISARKIHHALRCYFPNGSDLEYVRGGMQGFSETLYGPRETTKCNPELEFEYGLFYVDPWGYKNTVMMTFCNDELTSVSVER